MGIEHPTLPWLNSPSHWVCLASHFFSSPRDFSLRSALCSSVPMPERMENDQPEVQANHFSYFYLRRLTLIGKQDLRISSLSHSGDTVYTVLPDTRMLNIEQRRGGEGLASQSVAAAPQTSSFYIRPHSHLFRSRSLLSCVKDSGIYPGPIWRCLVKSLFCSQLLKVPKGGRAQ